MSAKSPAGLFGRTSSVLALSLLLGDLGGDDCRVLAYAYQ